MDIYDNHTAVDYGRVLFDPEAKLGSKQRTITLPTNTPVDSVITGYFTKRAPGAVQSQEAGNRPRPKTLAEIQNEGALKVLRSMCEGKGIVVEDDWDADRMQTEIENFVAPPTASTLVKVLPEHMDGFNKDELQESCGARDISFVEEDTKAELRDKLVAWAAK